MDAHQGVNILISICLVAWAGLNILASHRNLMNARRNVEVARRNVEVARENEKIARRNEEISRENADRLFQIFSQGKKAS